jgi:DNA-binding PadR family transcriptional regulator
LEVTKLNVKLSEYLGNPVATRLLFEIHLQGQTTAKKLAEIYADIPQTSLYRYLGRMLKDDILKVVEENKIRGTVEKVYALNVELHMESITSEMRKNLTHTFSQYMSGFMREFKEYEDRKDIDVSGSNYGFSTIPLYLTDKEFEEMGLAIQAIIQPLLANTSTDGRKLRNVGIIFTPPKD